MKNVVVFLNFMYSFLIEEVYHLPFTIMQLGV